MVDRRHGNLRAGLWKFSRKCEEAGKEEEKKKRGERCIK
jgi:hypothetical protein